MKIITISGRELDLQVTGAASDFGTVQGLGYASEATHAVAEWAFGHDAGEIFFVVVRPNNVRGAATECTEQTDKYVGLILPVLRLRPAVLDVEAHDSHLPPNTA